MPLSLKETEGQASAIAEQHLFCQRQQTQVVSISLHFQKYIYKALPLWWKNTPHIKKKGIKPSKQK